MQTLIKDKSLASEVYGDYVNESGNSELISRIENQNDFRIINEEDSKFYVFSDDSWIEIQGVGGVICHA